MINGVNGATTPLPSALDSTSAIQSHDGHDHGLTGLAEESSTGGSGESEVPWSSPTGPNNTDQMGLPHSQSGKLAEAQMASDAAKEAVDLVQELVALLAQLLQQLEGGGQEGGISSPVGGAAPPGVSAPLPGGGAAPQGISAPPPGGGGGPSGAGGSSGSGNIPLPTENVETFQLGNKTVTIGSDGTASAAEVQQTKQTLQNMYQTSPTFRDQIDNNPNGSLEVTVGRNSDNTSWGASDGRIFMNINNVAPTNNDSFQGLVSHEVAHTQGFAHGPQLDSIEEQVAAEAA